MAVQLWPGKRWRGSGEEEENAGTLKVDRGDDDEEVGNSRDGHRRAAPWNAPPAVARHLEDSENGGAAGIEGTIERAEVAAAGTEVAITGTDRAIAVTDRAIAVTDRAIAVIDRAIAVTDRAIAVIDRAIAVTDRAIADTDRAFAVTGRAIAVTDRAIAKAGVGGVGVSFTDHGHAPPAVARHLFRNRQRIRDRRP